MLKSNITGLRDRKLINNPVLYQEGFQWISVKEYKSIINKPAYQLNQLTYNKLRCMSITKDLKGLQEAPADGYKTASTYIIGNMAFENIWSLHQDRSNNT